MRSSDLHEIIRSKGFWDKKLTDLESITWRQLCHVFSEITEYYNASSPDNKRVEAADVCIVIADLLGGHDVDFDIRGVPADNGFHPPVKALAGIMQEYRKQGTLNVNALKSIISYYKRAVDGLDDAIDEKMKANANRPKLYGVAR